MTTGDRLVVSVLGLSAGGTATAGIAAGCYMLIEDVSGLFAFLSMFVGALGASMQAGLARRIIDERARCDVVRLSQEASEADHRRALEARKARVPDRLPDDVR